MLGVWQVHNQRTNDLFRSTEQKWADEHGQVSDVIDAWHGTHEDNIFSLAINGFDTSRRMGQVYGSGEYFAKDPNVSVSYCKGGKFMFLCKLLLGQADVHHTWVADQGYYVVKQEQGDVQALPLYVVRFGHGGGGARRGIGGVIVNIANPSDVWGTVVAEEPYCYRLSSGRVAKYQSEGVRWTWAGGDSPLSRELDNLSVNDTPRVSAVLARMQRGGQNPCVARREAGMAAEESSFLWLGWLDPALAVRNNDSVERDVVDFLQPFEVAEVFPERNGARIGAYVRLSRPISKAQYQELTRRKYQGRWTISVDDAQPKNSLVNGKPCPRLTGPSKYCRGWNIRGHKAWNWGCRFAHPEQLQPTAKASFSLEALSVAKTDEIMTEFSRGFPFHNGQPKVLRVQKVKNPVLERLYQQRHKFLSEKHEFVVEKDLWHGTHHGALSAVLTHGLQPPSDTTPGDKCPHSGGKGLSSTLCSTECTFCVDPHEWRNCHMFGLGVYLADSSRKSHRYVRPDSNNVHSMLFCRTLLGNPYLIEGNLLSPPALHNECWCQDPSDSLDAVAEDWNVAKGHDSYYVKGLAGRQKSGLGVENSEYILFQPFQVLPLYLVEYELNPF